MIRLANFVVVLACLTACVPAAAPVSSEGAAATTDPAACRARGGTLMPVGRLRTVQCVVAYADAGKRCTSGDQCGGDCRAPDITAAVPGRPAAGVCQATSEAFGCHARVEGGIAQAPLCMD